MPVSFNGRKGKLEVVKVLGQDDESEVESIGAAQNEAPEELGQGAVPPAKRSAGSDSDENGKGAKKHKTPRRKATSKETLPVASDVPAVPQPSPAPVVPETRSNHRYGEPPTPHAWRRE